ncbi:pentapeptide repeat-containing protein [Sulfitobacter dubius]|uniref:pentapeptide repeat-containing protein n=1 Tax=Sulfitobacter dubius TaxID=218673 RepID=UPI002941F3C6|nr:pentapeptide repeat-containing protein [Sulfitobacter dubius]WOI31108.1 pentapeptide repeat-containing protein [Sulfitobacter dubius]
MLGRCPGCNFEQLNLTGRKLTGIDLTEAELRDVDLSESGLNLGSVDIHFEAMTVAARCQLAA